MRLGIQFLATALSLAALASTVGQGTFQNLDFEAALLVPIPGDTYGRVQSALAFPGWTVTGVQPNAALYNSAFLDTSGIGILDQAAAGFVVHDRLIQGNFTALLMAGNAFTPLVPTDTTLAQTGLIPAGTQSLLFNAHTFIPNPGTFGVTLGGQALTLLPIRSDANSTLYGADIHAWAEQSAELAFTAYAQRPHQNNVYLFLDSIQFSNQPIPEPSVFGLFGLGALFLGWRFVHARR